MYLCACCVIRLLYVLALFVSLNFSLYVYLFSHPHILLYTCLFSNRISLPLMVLWPIYLMHPLLEIFRCSWHTHSTLGRTPLDERSAPRRDLYLTTRNTHNRQTSMPSGGIRTHNFSKREPADSRLRPRGHRDRRVNVLPITVHEGREE